MSKWNELFGIPKKKDAQKRVSTPAKASSKKRAQVVQIYPTPEGSRIRLRRLT